MKSPRNIRKPNRKYSDLSCFEDFSSLRVKRSRPGFFSVRRKNWGDFLPSPSLALIAGCTHGKQTSLSRQSTFQPLENRHWDQIPYRPHMAEGQVSMMNSKNLSFTAAAPYHLLAIVVILFAFWKLFSTSSLKFIATTHVRIFNTTYSTYSKARRRHNLTTISELIFIWINLIEVCVDTTERRRYLRCFWWLDSQNSVRQLKYEKIRATVLAVHLQYATKKQAKALSVLLFPPTSL